MTTGNEKLRTQRFFQLNSTTSVCPTFARIKDFQIVHNFFFKVANKLGLGRLSYHFSSGFRIPADFKSFVVSFFFDSEIWHFKKIVLGAFLSLTKRISANFTRFPSLVLSKHPTFMSFGLKIGPTSLIFDIWLMHQKLDFAQQLLKNRTHSTLNFWKIGPTLHSVFSFHLTFMSYGIYQTFPC